MRSNKDFLRIPPASTRKKIYIGIVGLCVLGSGIAWGTYQYQLQQSLKLDIARSNMVRNEAAQYNIKLLPEAQIKDIVTSIISNDDKEVTFKNISLVDFKQLHELEAHSPTMHFHQDNLQKMNSTSSVDDTNFPPPMANQSPFDESGRPLTAPATNSNTGSTKGNGAKVSLPDMNTVHAYMMNKPAPKPPAFHPLYCIEAIYDGVTYDLLIDAINGHVLKSKVRPSLGWTL